MAGIGPAIPAVFVDGPWDGARKVLPESYDGHIVYVLEQPPFVRHHPRVTEEDIYRLSRDVRELIREYKCEAITSSGAFVYQYQKPPERKKHTFVVSVDAAGGADSTVILSVLKDHVRAAIRDHRAFPGGIEGMSIRNTTP